MKAILWFFCPFLANSVSAGRLELPANGLKGHCLFNYRQARDTSNGYVVHWVATASIVAGELIISILELVKGELAVKSHRHAHVFMPQELADLA